MNDTIVVFTISELGMGGVLEIKTKRADCSHLNTTVTDPRFLFQIMTGISAYVNNNLGYGCSFDVE